jgi:hypothetical protein
VARRRNSARSPRYLAAARVVSQALRDRGTVAVVYLPFPTGGAAVDDYHLEHFGMRIALQAICLCD